MTASETGQNNSVPAPELRYEVKSLDGRQLLPAGTRLEGRVMEELIHRDTTRWRQLSLLEYGSVRADLRDFALSHAVYRNIFSPAGVTESMEAFMASVTLPLPVLECLSFFENHDAYTYRHVLMVFALYSLLTYDMGGAPPLGATPFEVAAGHLHDIGKICVPLAILKKSAPLLRAERERVEHHAAAGYVLLTYYQRSLQDFAARVARDHHERRDGSGYPLGARQQDARIEMVAICDMYDALVNPRPYRRETFDNRSALEAITDLAAQGKFSWDCVTRLVAANRKARPRLDECVVSLEKRGTPPAENSYGLLQEDVPPSA